MYYYHNTDVALLLQESLVHRTVPSASAAFNSSAVNNASREINKCHLIVEEVPFYLHCMAFSHVGDPENCFLLTVHHTYSPHQWIASRRGHRAGSRQLPCAFTEMCMAFEDEFTECVSHFLLTIKMLILELL